MLYNGYWGSKIIGQITSLMTLVLTFFMFV